MSSQFQVKPGTEIHVVRSPSEAVCVGLQLGYPVMLRPKGALPAPVSFAYDGNTVWNIVEATLRFSPLVPRQIEMATPRDPPSAQTPERLCHRQ